MSWFNVGTIRTLTVGRAEEALWTWSQGLPRPLVDLSRLSRFDAYGLSLLALLGWWAREEGGLLRIILPEREEVARRLSGTGLFRVLAGGLWVDRAPPETEEEGLLHLVRVDGEEGIGAVVDEFGEMLSARFPFGERTNRLLEGAVVELLQNIPHHAAAGRMDLKPVGFAVLEEEEDHLHLAVVDAGVGLKGSLSLNPRFQGLNSAEALERVLVEGVSRFDDPGRGGALKRIRQIAVRHAGKLYVRSGEGAFLQEDVEWQVGPVFFFPGVQISLRLPKKLFL